MRILQLIQRPQKRGAETFALQLTEHLVARGHQVVVVTLFSGDQELKSSGELIHLSRPSGKRILDIDGFRKINAIIREKQIDIVQCNAGDTLKYAVLSRFLFRWKAKVIFRNASTVSQYIKSTPVKILNGWFYKNTDHVVSVAAFTRDDLTRLFPVVKNKTSVIPVGVEWDESQSRLSNNYDVVHVGGFTFEKNHKGLINIIVKLIKAKPDLKFLLVGDGPLRPEIEKLAKEKNLENHITFTGSVKNVLDHIRSARMLVLPSLLEGLPAVILESFMCKIPVVAYDAGGIKEVLSEQTGVIITKDNEDLFAAAVMQILDRPDSAKIDAAFKLVRDNFDNRVIAARFEGLYASLLR